MSEIDGNLSQSLIAFAEQGGDTWGDGGCWSEVLTGAKQRANLLHFYSGEEQASKCAGIQSVLS